VTRQQAEGWSPHDFDFELPTAQIAQSPSERREQARLLVAGDPCQHLRFGDVRSVLPEGALVVLNDSRVVPARLFFERQGDARMFELLWCEPSPSVTPGQEIRAWVRGAKKMRVGDRLMCGGASVAYVRADEIDPRARVFRVESGDLFEVATSQGSMPLPPYIARPEGTTDEDKRRYQTVYARPPGSVAAPTAGLHFTEDLLAQIPHTFVTLHVGPGTFLPMEAEDVREHRVGTERFSVSEETAAQIESARASARPVIAVGTTTTRALESVAKRSGGRVVPGSFDTDLVITPGFDFQVIDGLLTNFHLPRSSLLMLVCSLGGVAQVLAGYQEAVREGYRFYSYGDAMFVPRVRMI